MNNKTKFLNSDFLVSAFSDAHSHELKVKDINNLAWNTAATVYYLDELGNVIRRKRAIHILEHYP